MMKKKLSSIQNTKLKIIINQLNLMLMNILNLLIYQNLHLLLMQLNNHNNHINQSQLLIKLKMYIQIQV
jgi:hypothetical protein